MKADYTMVSRSPRGSTGRTEIGFVATIGSNVFVSRPVPGMPLPVCHSYPDHATASRDGWHGAVIDAFIGPVADPARG
jgi:hypothetical protein